MTRAVVAYGLAAMGLHRIEAGVLPGNDASVRVLEKLGFREEGRLRATDAPAIDGGGGSIDSKAPAPFLIASRSLSCPPRQEGAPSIRALPRE
jgi:hypothetical protein